MNVLQIVRMAATVDVRPQLNALAGSEIDIAMRTVDIKYLTHSVEVTREELGELLVRTVGDRKDRSTDFPAVPAELTASVTIR